MYNTWENASIGCAKTAEPIELPYDGMVSGVGQRIVD